MPLAINSDNFESEVMQSDKPVLIDFWAPWCGPCRMIAPIVDELDKELEGHVKVAKINVDDEPEIASRFNVMSIPTLTLVKNGEVVATSIGARSKEDIRKILGI